MAEATRARASAAAAPWSQGRCAPPRPTTPHPRPYGQPQPPSLAISAPRVTPGEAGGLPCFFPDSKHPGYKIWIGDLPADSNDGIIRQRIQDTLTAENEGHLWPNILSVVVKAGRASSGSSYVTVTVADLRSAQVGQLKWESFFVPDFGFKF